MAAHSAAGPHARGTVRRSKVKPLCALGLPLIMSPSAAGRRLILRRSPGSTCIMCSTDLLPSKSSHRAKTDMRQRRLDIIGGGFPYLVAERCVALPLKAGLSLYRGKLGLPAPAGMDVSWHRSPADVSVAHGVRNQRAATSRGRHWRQRQQRFYRAAPAPWVGDGGNDPVRGFQIWALGRYVLMQRSLGAGDSTLP
jgi:hypothetical protein